MKIFLSHSSSLDVLRGIEAPHGSVERPSIVRASSITSLDGATANARALRAAGLLTGEQMLHVLVPDRRKSRSIDNVTVHLHRGPLPHGSFLQCGDGIYASGPELTLVQLANTRSALELICVASELVGGYSLGPSVGNAANSRTTGTFLRSPLATLDGIKRFLEQMPGARGSAALRKILPLVPENAWSPMECSLALLLCLPEKMGGFGLPRPLLNHRISFSPEGRRIANRASCYCDLFWPDGPVVIEYDGVETHAHSSERDDSKQLALEQMGIRVFRSTIAQFKDPASTAALANLVLESIPARGRRTRSRCDVEIAARRMELTNKLTRQF